MSGLVFSLPLSRAGKELTSDNLNFLENSVILILNYSSILSFLLTVMHAAPGSDDAGNFLFDSLSGHRSTKHCESISPENSFPEIRKIRIFPVSNR